MVEQDSQPAPQAAKKNKKKAKNVGHIKAACAGLEGFVDLVDPSSSESAEEREEDISSLDAGFALRMHKRVVSAQRDTTSNSKGPGGKRLKQFGPYEEA